MIVCLAIVGYYLCLLGLSYAITRTGGNDAFFRAERRSPWYMVAFGMIGASLRLCLFPAWCSTHR